MKGLGVKSDLLGQTARYWRGHSKQELHSEKETRRRCSLSLDPGHEERIRKVLQEDGCSSMYVQVIIMCSYLYKLPYVVLVCLAIFLYPGVDSHY
jgi:hypothetical protein